MKWRLGLDLGTKRIGVALSDEMGWTAQPLEVIQSRSLTKDLAAITALIRNNEVEEVVLGLPRHMNGRLGPEAERVKNFGARLAEEAPIKISYWDERLSTVSAERALLEADVSRAKRKKVVDKIAAGIILQGYLDFRSSRDNRP